ncbi:TPA_exp: Arginine metabolism regulation protein iii [Trichophyton benhamiae CBS 112371]|uniref:Kinase n=1 Tax=Arthroderma benhamiae (strain ATCC MYA-4681 / CBS 112371) TaxID=663331 RepID=D4B3M1_ARTBC|nr:arginine metabolism regulation protein iii [Trichophyton benhamiae CBS 112371]EFE29719.1 arginine metabolism regulation protein iii [Trichophyton benhamiae CBS 112371]DAA72971.1 TPA_exp: Arginine metabolism regulation protein iii [Trichophyton benhamiae CBS 112371]
MPPSSKSQKLDEDSFVAFDHAAAGHEGVRCDESGSLIAKPCTEKEILFYESGANHPAVQRYMPTFIGSLRAGAPKEALDISNADADAPLVITSAEAPVERSSLPMELATETDSISITRPAKKPDQPWVPSGGKKLDTGLSIVLENITDGFVRPNVLDVKLGARLWDDDAIPDKRKKLDQVSAETTSGSLGFRIAGMKTWVGGDTQSGADVDVTAQYLASTASETIKSKAKVVESEGYLRFDKWYGRGFDEHNVHQGFKTFLASAKAGTVDRSAFIAKRIATELRAMQSVLESEESRMYSASVLIVYEGDPETFEKALEVEREQANKPEDLSTRTTGHGGDTDEEAEEEDEDEEELPKVHDIRLIDFAHARWTPGQGPDENLLRGLRNVAKIMEDLSKVSN